jgi:hypothetical protein
MKQTVPKCEGQPTFYIGTKKGCIILAKLTGKGIIIILFVLSYTTHKHKICQDIVMHLAGDYKYLNPSF